MAGDEGGDKVRSEIDLLKKNYDFKVIENVDSFKFLVTVYLENRKASIKFQLTDEYPTKRPEVILVGLDMPDEEMERYKAEKAIFTMTEFTEFVNVCIHENRATVVEKNLKPTPSAATKKTKKKSSKKSKGEANDPEGEKKVSMRTSEDVVKRIKWDPELNEADFTVGYLDRFLGIVENNFTAFNWDDLASVDYSDTAIPKHRIHYFKYRNVVVWDKTKRLDNVFGSTGSSLTIKDVVENYSEFEEEGEKEADTRQIDIVTSSEKKEEDEEEERSKRGRPNYFFCQRVRDEKILAEIKRVQDGMKSVDKSFAEFMVPRERIHMTLCTLDLRDEAELELVRSAMEENKEELVHLSKDLKLELKGVDQFFNRVVYCKASGGQEEEERLATLVDHLKVIVVERGLRIGDAYDFVPHVTLAKVSRQVSQRTIPRSVYRDFEDVRFGSLRIDELILCDMSKEREEDGFYKHHHRLELK